MFQRNAETGRGVVTQSQLVLNGYRKWKKATTDFKDHANAELHKLSVTFADNFNLSFKAGSNVTLDLLQRKSNEEAIRNQHVLSVIVRTVLFLGKQNIPFRGHRDFGRIKVNDEETENEGNFRSMVQHLAKHYDETLRNHLENSPANAMYTSPAIQNELIDICGRLVLSKVVNSINKSKCFSVIADETTDASTTEQLTVCVRYITTNLEDDLIVREDFLGFCSVSDLTGEGLADSILTKLRDVGVDLEYLRGSDYNGLLKYYSFILVLSRCLILFGIFTFRPKLRWR